MKDLSYLLFLLVQAFVYFLGEPSYAEFITLSSSKTEHCHVELAKARQMELNAKCYKLMLDDAPLEHWQHRLEFSVGQINKKQFQHLMHYYSGWSPSSSQIPYVPGREYQLSDFLPPVIQALNGHRFVPELGTAPDEFYQSVQLTPPENRQATYSLYLNCWGVTYEALRGKPDDFTIVQANASLMLNTLRANSTLVTVLQEPEQFPLPNLMQPGDIVLIMHKHLGVEYLDHTALMIDDGLYFEKAGTAGEVPIRLVEEEVLTKIWQPGVFQYELRRPNRNLQLPPPTMIFSIRASSVLEVFSAFRQFLPKLAQDISVDWQVNEKGGIESVLWFDIQRLPLQFESGRAKLPNKAFQRSNFH